MTFNEREIFIFKTRIMETEKENRYTYKEIGERFNLTGGRIRQIEGKMMWKIYKLLELCKEKKRN